MAWWDKYIDWEKRKQGEQRFFARQLARYGAVKIFDAACGTGYNSIRLLQEGFLVISNEVDPRFADVAVGNASNLGLKLEMTNYDWRSLPPLLEERFQGVVCLGNSFTYIHDPVEQVSVLENFKRLLLPGYPLIIDQRNYDYFLEQRDFILQNPRQNFQDSRKYYYCGTEVISYPVVIENKRVVLEFFDTIEGKVLERGEYYPFRREELRELLRKAGFSSVETYSDFKKEFSAEADFYQHIAVR